MGLVTPKLGVRIEQRILVVESGDVTDVQHAVLHPIDPAAAVSLCIGGEAERMRDAASGITIVGQFPKFFNADAVDLRLDRKSTRLNSSHVALSRMPSS